MLRPIFRQVQSEELAPLPALGLQLEKVQRMTPLQQARTVLALALGGAGVGSLQAETQQP